MESEKNCILVIVGVDEYGKKEVVAIDDGFRESKESWQGLLLDLKGRGLKHAPKLAIGDGALGFWSALTEEYPDSVQQRCWVHKTSNILNKLPKSQQTKAKQMIHDIYLAASREEAETAWKKFISAYCAKYPKATECLLKNEKELLAFYDFPGNTGYICVQLILLNLSLLPLSTGLENPGIVFREILSLLLPINYLSKQRKGGSRYEVKTVSFRLLIWKSL
jgi:transposase-like protein